MKIIRQKEFGSLKEKAKAVGESVKKFYDKNPTAYLTSVTAAASTSNLAMNATRKQQDKEYQGKQIEAMKDLTNALTGVDKTLKKEVVKKNTAEQQPKFRRSIRRLFSENNNDSNMIKFRRKDFSILSDTIRGATIGGSLGVMASPLAGLKKLNPIFRKLEDKYVIKEPKFDKDGKLEAKQSNNYKFAKRIVIPLAGAVIGAALGALAGSIKELDQYVSRKTTVDKRMMDKIVEDLEKTGFKEGEHFTRDPKTADRIKSPVSIAITKNSGDLRLLVNTVADKKLKDLTSQILKTLPNSSAVTQEERNRYNEISITTISDGSADIGLIAGICEKFIRHKYPVYLVEVG